MVIARAVMLAALMLFQVQQQVTAQTFIGAGTISCGEFLRLRSVESSPGSNFRDLASAYQIKAWLDGFLSGYNVGATDVNPSTADILISRPDGAALYAFVDNYCKSTPLDPVVSAASALVKELRSRARR
jgi:hypothetical protein